MLSRHTFFTLWGTTYQQVSLPSFIVSTKRYNHIFSVHTKHIPICADSDVLAWNQRSRCDTRVPTSWWLTQMRESPDQGPINLPLCLLIQLIHWHLPPPSRELGPKSHGELSNSLFLSPLIRGLAHFQHSHWHNFKVYVVGSGAGRFFSHSLHSLPSWGTKADHYRHLKSNNAYIILWQWCSIGKPSIPPLSIGWNR